MSGWRERRRAGAGRGRFALVGLVVALVGASLPWAASVVTAAVPPGVEGTVWLDTNLDGAVGTSTSPGLTEPGFAGAQVDLVCVADNSVIGTTTTDAAGAWVIEAVTTTCTQAKVRVTVTDDRYSITNIAGTDTPRTADPQIGESAPFTFGAATDLDFTSAVRPDWYLDVTVPVDGATNLPAIFTGSAPFDSGCPAAGLDCSASDQTVRNQDTVTFTWAVTASSFDDLTPTLGDVVFEQTLNLVGGAVANFDRVPARCNPSGGGGNPPPVSQIVALPSGTVVPEGQMPPAGSTSVVLTCNLGVWSQTGDAVTFQPIVKISGASPNGSSFTADARVYAVDDANRPTAVPDRPNPLPPFDITAAPAFDLAKGPFAGYAPGSTDLGDGNGTVPGYYTYVTFTLSTQRKTGVEALGNTWTFREDVFGMLPDGTTAYPTMKYALFSCDPAAGVGVVGGKSPGGGAYYGFFAPSQQVKDSGTCTLTRDDPTDPTSDYTVTVTGTDFGSSQYPTQTYGGADLTAGPYYVASFQLAVFIPASSLDAADGTPGDGLGSLVAYNRVAGFDPNGVSGASNFGSGVEPGYCDPASVDGNNLDAPGMPHCQTMPDGSRSNDVAGPRSYIIGSGSFSKSELDVTQMYEPHYGTLNGSTVNHDGAVRLQPGEVADSYVYFGNASVTAFTNTTLCDVFDNTMGVLVPTSQTVTGGSASIYAYVANANTTQAQGAAFNQLWIIEYGHISVNGDDPLSGGFDLTSGRYNGTWTGQGAARCDDTAAAGGWQPSPGSVPGGLDAVNAVRARPAVDPATGQPSVIPPSHDLRLIFGTRMRDTFLGGPHDGEFVPSGAVFANFGSFRTDQMLAGGWAGRYYVPSPENTALDGDRVTITRAMPAVQKRTIIVNGVGDGAADFGQTGAAVAGNQVIWEIVGTIEADAQVPDRVENLVITDVLPRYAIYDETCTAAIAGGTVPDAVQYDTPNIGETTLTWNLGDWTPNVLIPNRRICTGTDTLAPNGTSLVNSTRLTYDNAPFSPSDTHTVVLDQAGSLQLRKTVDAPVDLLNDDQVYTMSAQNFSDTLTVGAPTIIEVLPYNGDASNSAGVNRTPGSNFVGRYVLATAPTVTNIAGGAYSGAFTFTSAPPATINQNLNLNTNTWCTQVQFGTAGCPANLAAVTGIKFVGAANLTPTTAVPTSGFTITFSVQAGDPADPFGADANRAGNVYSDRFTAFSSTFMGQGNQFQVLASNRVLVRTTGFSVGDWVFADADLDGAYTDGTDGTVPDGTPVQIWYHPTGGGAPVMVGSTTTSGGKYLFTGLPQGSYHVAIPASAFVAGGLLAGWTVSPAPASADIDENDDVSHDAVAAGGGVQTAVFTLGATVTGAAINGAEPTGDDLHATDDTSTADDLSNLAVDLALVEPGSLELTKAVVDPVPGDAFGAPASFAVTVTCTDAAGVVTVHQATVPANGTATVAPITGGSTCVVVEADPAPAVAAYSPSNTVDIEPGGSETVGITNTYPAVAFTKKVDGAPVLNDDGTVTVSYLLTATNNGGTDVTYDLDDQPRYGGGVTVIGATIVAVSGGVAPSTAWNGSTNIAVVRAAPLAVGATHVYRVTVTVSVAGTITVAETDCELVLTETGTGLLNTARLTVRGVTIDGTDCGTVPTTTTTTTTTLAPTTPSTTTTVPPGRLPITGSDSGGNIAIAILVTIAGLALAFVARRRRATT